MLTQSIILAIAQISTDPGNIERNTEKIIHYIKKAKKKGAKIIVFPELAIPGYMSLDLMLQPQYIERNLQALKSVIKETADIMVIVGFIDHDSTKLDQEGNPVRYNCAAILLNQKVLAIQDKTLLPNYDVFFEDRYFMQGRGRKVIEFEGIKLGIQICEDLWDESYPIKVSQDLVEKGAEILINISGSPFYIEKKNDREQLIKKVSAMYKVPFVYVNCVGGQDGYEGELVFDGQSMVFNDSGQVVRVGKEFKEELVFIDIKDLYVNKSNSDDSIFFEMTQTEQLYEALVLGIKDYFRRSNIEKAFIGLSGGIDSAVAAALAVEALGPDAITGISMPSYYSSLESIDDAKELATNLGINFKTVSINSIFDGLTTVLDKEFEGLKHDVTEENIQARIRGILLMAHANKFNGLVISTGNKTEMALGYMTLYGDMCGAIAPLGDVSKLRVYNLAELINNKAEKQIISKSILKKIPSAELKENQTDEESLGASYDIISPLVDEIIEKTSIKKELYRKYPPKVVDHISQLINKSEYKRRQAPPGIKVTKKAFGIGRRIPIAHNFIN